jgi:hypothetical protein
VRPAVARIELDGFRKGGKRHPVGLQLVAPIVVPAAHEGCSGLGVCGFLLGGHMRQERRKSVGDRRAAAVPGVGGADVVALAPNRLRAVAVDQVNAQLRAGNGAFG